MILSFKTKAYAVILSLLMTPFSLLVAQIEDEHFILKDFDRAADKAYVETMIIRPIWALSSPLMRSQMGSYCWVIPPLIRCRHNQ